VARSREAIERSQATLRREGARQQRGRERTLQEYGALASQMAQLLGEREREQRETAMRAHAMRKQARGLRSIARTTAEQAASIRNEARAARQQVPAATRPDEHGQVQADATVPAGLRSGDAGTGPGDDDEGQGITLSSAGSRGDEQPSDAPDSPEQRTGTSLRSRTDLNGAGRPHRNLRI